MSQCWSLPLLRRPMITFSRGRFFDYIKDVTYCWLYGVKMRLDKNDIKVIIIWASISLIILILSFVINYSLILVYMLSVAIMWILTKKLRTCNEQKSQINNVIEVMKYDIHDMENIPVTIGQWIGKRNYMEDNYIVCTKQKLFGVFDGHSGSDAVMWIKNNFVHQYEDFFNDLLFDDSNNVTENIDQIIIKTLEKTMIQMDHDICNYFLNSGAVGVCLKIHPDKIYCSFTGDSGACLLTHDDKLVTLTQSHTMYNFNEYCRYRDTMDPLYPKKGVILRTHSGLMPTRTIGDINYKVNDLGVISSPESMIYTIDHNDLTGFVPYNWKMIIIGTDGIWDCFTPKQLINLIQTNITIDDNGSIDLTDSMTIIQKITTNVPNLIDKLTGKYNGDNCTLMCIINKNMI